MPNLGSGGPPERSPSTPGEIAITRENLESAPDAEIGRGTSSVVRRVELDHAGRSVPLAVKQPDFEGTMSTEQFDRIVTEAERWAKLTDATDDQSDGVGRGDHIVTVVDWGTEPLPWIAMEYMDGGSLRALLDDGDGRLPLAQALWVGRAVCEGVYHAHHRGVAHLDIKPANVLLHNTTRGWQFPKVSDWGLSKTLLDDSEGREGLTAAYAAPEQFDSDRYGRPAHETDIYQIGVLVYELLTGRVPFKGTAPDIAEAKLSEHEQPPRPGAVADVPEAVGETVLSALGREKRDRHENIVYFRDELDALFEKYHDDRSSRGPVAGGSATPSEVDSQQGADVTTSNSPGANGGGEGARAVVGSTDATDATGPGALPGGTAGDSKQPAMESWDEYRRELEDRRENAVLYGPLKRILHRDLAAELAHAQQRREKAAEEIDAAKSRARELCDTLEAELDTMMFGDPLSDEAWDRAGDVEDTRARLDTLLQDRTTYLTSDEQETAAGLRDRLEEYERYLFEKRQLDRVVDAAERQLDAIDERADESLVDDTLLNEDKERNLVRDLDDVSKALRQSKLDLDTEALTQQDVKQFEELLARERQLREHVTEHNPEIAHRRYTDRVEAARDLAESTDDALAAYRADGRAFPGATGEYLDALDDEIETVDAFLDSREAEYLSSSQFEDLDQVHDRLGESRATIRAKTDFETHLSEFQSSLQEFQATVDDTLDGETYLKSDERAHLDEVLGELHSRLDTVRQDGVLKALTDADRDRFEESAEAVDALERRVEAYNPDLVQRRYEEHVERTETVLTEFEAELAPCQTEGGPLPAAGDTYVATLEEGIQELSTFLDRPQAEHLSTEQRERIESLRAELDSQRTFVQTKEIFEDKLAEVHAELATLRETVDERLDMKTYLTTPEREKLREQVSRVREGLDAITASDLLDRLAPTDADRVEACGDALAAFESDIERYNDRFVGQERDRLADSLDGLSGAISPNEKQQLAVVRDEQHNRVIAGPGTGKTHSLLCRVRYLIDSGVALDDILVLTFNKHTKGELQQRLREEYEVTGVDVSTLHSLGNDLVREAYPDEFTLVDQTRCREVGRLVRELRDTDAECEHHYESFLDLYRAEQLSGAYRVREDFYDSLRFQSKKTFRGEELVLAEDEPRTAHAKIADTLFGHGVEYRYRQYADWVDPADGEPYIPDFTLPDSDIVIDYLPSGAVRREREWYEQRRAPDQLRRLHENADRTGLIIRGEDISLSSVEGILRAKLSERGIPMDDPYDERARVNEAYEHNILWRDIEGKLAEFIKKAKTNRIDPSARLGQLDEDEHPMRYHFSHLGAALFDAYQERYAAYGAYDYADMMLRARESAEQGRVDDRLEYRHVLVDEFQDLNLVQVELLQAILDRAGDAHLFAVGDDWQSIYGFRGARPEFFVEFEERFAPATTTDLAVNYRCPSAVVKASSALMDESDIETEKSLEAAPSNLGATPTVYTLAGKDDWQYETNVKTWAAKRVEQSLEEGYPPGEVLILAHNREGPFVPRITSELQDNGIAVDDGRHTVTVDTAHSAKGSEFDHVIIVNAVGDRPDGFPSEERDSSLTRLVETGEQNHIAEERRLFYMALTRTKEQLDIQTRVNHESTFLNPLDEHVTEESIPIDWDADRVSVTGEVKKPKKLSRPRQVGTVLVDDYRIPYRIPFEAVDVELLEEGRHYRLEDVGVGEYEGEPQLDIDETTTVERL